MDTRDNNKTDKNNSNENEKVKITCENVQKTNKMENCQQWLENSEFDTLSCCDESTIDESSIYTSSVSDSDFSEIISDLDINATNITKSKGEQSSKIVTGGDNSVMQVNQVDVVKNILKGDHSVQMGNIHIENSSRVHIGNITYVYLGGEKDGHSSKSDISSYANSTSSRKPSNYEEEVEEKNNSDRFIGQINPSIDTNFFSFINRRTWLAQPPLEKLEPLEEPVQYIIISHTATELGLTQAENVFLVRNIQCFHIESRNWNDIAYNFLIGGDGNIYEGRGWGNVGSHTRGFNFKSIGISFVGCFMAETPPECSLAACKMLIKKGVDDGHVHPNYKLLAHCQCTTTESPGRKLFEEIQTWPHWVHHDL